MSPICPQAPRERISTKVGTGVTVADVITRTNFFWRWVVERRFFAGRKSIGTIDSSQSLLTHDPRQCPTLSFPPSVFTPRCLYL